MYSLAEIKNAELAESPEVRGQKCFHWPFYYEFLAATGVYQKHNSEHTLEISAGQKSQEYKAT